MADNKNDTTGPTAKPTGVIAAIVNWLNVRTNTYLALAAIFIGVSVVLGRLGHQYIAEFFLVLGPYFYGRHVELVRTVKVMEETVEAILGAVVGQMGLPSTKPALRVIDGGKSKPKDDTTPPTARAAGFLLPHTGEDLDENFKPRNPQGPDGNAA